eukprot:TRINITY_DN12364_c0_g1_i3.p4 TRINITY_DN12364_c0_g1~~TRINITY_DN12364_c0_g1_i3.p4  ORF type:complete len:122 (+),score=14.16 TRINITY_DN12364_c0_g1_i3:92-457(+)
MSTLLFVFFFFNATATTEIYTLHIVGSVRCVQETDPSLWGSHISFPNSTVRHMYRQTYEMAPQAIFGCIELPMHPCIICVFVYGFHQQFMVDIIEQSLDVEFQHPIIFPTALASYINDVNG